MQTLAVQPGQAVRWSSGTIVSPERATLRRSTASKNSSNMVSTCFKGTSASNSLEPASRMRTLAVGCGLGFAVFFIGIERFLVGYEFVHVNVNKHESTVDDTRRRDHHRVADGVHAAAAFYFDLVTACKLGFKLRHYQTAFPVVNLACKARAQRSTVRISGYLSQRSPLSGSNKSAHLSSMRWLIW